MVRWLNKKVHIGLLIEVAFTDKACVRKNRTYRARRERWLAFYQAPNSFSFEWTRSRCVKSTAFLRCLVQQYSQAARKNPDDKQIRERVHSLMLCAWQKCSIFKQDLMKTQLLDSWTVVLCECVKNRRLAVKWTVLCHANRHRNLYSQSRNLSSAAAPSAPNLLRARAPGTFRALQPARPWCCAALHSRTQINAVKNAPRGRWAASRSFALGTDNKRLAST